MPALSADARCSVVVASLSRSIPADAPGSSPVSPSAQDQPAGQSPLRSPLKRQASVCSTRLGSTKSLTAAFYGDKQPVAVGVQFSSDVSRSDENVLDSPKQRRSFGSFPYTPSADSNSFHQYRSMDSSMSMADSEAYFSAAEEFEPISSDEGPGTYPGRKKKKKQTQQLDYSRGSIYHSVEGPLSGHGESVQGPRTLPFKAHPSQASFVSAVGGEEVVEHLYPAEGEKTGDSEQVTCQQPAMSCYQTYLTQLQVTHWSAKHPTNKRTSKSSLHRPLDLDTPTSEESASSLEQLSIPAFKVHSTPLVSLGGGPRSTVSTTWFYSVILAALLRESGGARLCEGGACQHRWWAPRVQGRDWRLDSDSVVTASLHQQAVPAPGSEVGIRALWSHVLRVLERRCHIGLKS